MKKGNPIKSCLLYNSRSKIILKIDTVLISLTIDHSEISYLVFPQQSTL